MNVITVVVCVLPFGLYFAGCADDMSPLVYEVAAAAPELKLDGPLCSSLCEAALQCDEGAFMADFERARRVLGEAGSSFADCMTLCTSGEVAARAYAAECLSEGQPATQCLFVADVLETTELCDSLDANWTINVER